MPVVEQPPSAIGAASLSHTNARSPAKKPSVGIMAFPPPPHCGGLALFESELLQAKITEFTCTTKMALNRSGDISLKKHSIANLMSAALTPVGVGDIPFPAACSAGYPALQVHCWEP